MMDALKSHWPEYLIEGACLALFMVSAFTFGTILERAFQPSRGAALSRCYRCATAPGATNNGCGRCADEGTIDAPERAFLAFRRKEEGER